MKGRLLIVDDNFDVRALIERAFDSYGYACDAVDGIEPAKRLLQQVEYDVLLADKNMPGAESGDEGGMELLRWARQNHPDVAVLLITGFGTVESAVEALKLGAFDYLLKPLEVNQLRCKVDRVREYRSFTNPRAALELHLNLLREVLGTADAVSPETEERINHLRERLDDLFRAFRVMEQTIIDQRLRLAEIAAFAERSRDELDEGDPSGPMLDHISAEAARRV